MRSSVALVLERHGQGSNTRQHAAREFDTETGLYYDRARYYDPNTGR